MSLVLETKSVTSLYHNSHDAKPLLSTDMLGPDIELLSEIMHELGVKHISK